MAVKPQNKDKNTNKSVIKVVHNTYTMFQVFWSNAIATLKIIKQIDHWCITSGLKKSNKISQKSSFMKNMQQMGLKRHKGE